MASTKQRLQEYANSSGAKPAVDRDRGIIAGVKILGLESKNGRTYKREAASAAIPLYEGAAVFVDHKIKGSARSYTQRMGHLTGVVEGKDGLYADFHFNPKHALAEQLAWDAENAPQHVGFSHDCEAMVTKKDGKTVVEEIVAVASVDLVANPATTASLYEGEDELPDDPVQREFCEHGLSACSDARSIVLGDEPIDIKKQRLTEVLATWKGELCGTTERTQSMELKDLTVKDIQEGRADIVEALQVDLKSAIVASDAELKTVKESLDSANLKIAEHESVQKATALNAQIASELTAAGLDSANKVAVSQSFMESLVAAADEQKRKSLIEDRVAVLGANGQVIVPATAPFAKIPATEGASEPRQPAKDTKELLERL